MDYLITKSHTYLASYQEIIPKYITNQIHGVLPKQKQT